MIFKILGRAKLVLCFLLLSGFFLDANSQTSEYKGQVVNGNSLQPINSASVVGYPGNQRTITDSNGNFVLITDVPLDSLSANYVGYLSETLTTQGNELDSFIFKIYPDNSGIINIGDISRIPIVPVNPIVIYGRRYMENPLGSQVFSLAQIGENEIKSTNLFSMQDALNQVPGVRMDSRGHNGSRRLSLRGTIARSPFGVRNVRMAINGFPITSSDGSSAIELLEPSAINSVNIHKGPTGSYNLPGTGGFIDARLRSMRSRGYIVEAGSGEFSGELASYRAFAHVQLDKRNYKSGLNVVFSNNDGFRDHEANNKTQLTYSGAFIKGKHELKFLAIGYSGKWELPGHIRSTQIDEDASQANTYSESNDAYVERRRFYAGLSYGYQISQKIDWENKVFGQLSDKINPYGTFPGFQGYKDEVSSDLGVRSELKIKIGNPYSEKFFLKTGMHAQFFNNELKEYVNDLGSKGDFKYENASQIFEGLLFSSLEWIPNGKFKATGQLGLNLYNIENSGINSADDNLAYSESSVNLLPRVGFSQQLWNNVTFVNASYSRGVSYPGIFEWVDTETGFFSTDLKAEDASNIEVGLKSQALRRRLDFNLNLYYASVNNTITQNETEDQAIFYENSGESSQLGAESIMSFNITKNGINNTTVYTSLAYQNYQLVNDTGSAQLFIPGVTPLTVAGGVRKILKDFTLDVHGRYLAPFSVVLGEEPDNLTEVVLLNAKLSFEFNNLFGFVNNKIPKMAISLGVNNALDRTYSSFVRLNARGPIYNPMAGRNYYISFSLRRF